MSFRAQLQTKIDEAFVGVEALVVGTIRTPEAQSEWLQGHADGYTCGYYDGLTDARELYDAARVAVLRAEEACANSRRPP